MFNKLKELYSLFWSQLLSNTFHPREGLCQNENVKIRIFPSSGRRHPYLPWHWRSSRLISKHSIQFPRKRLINKIGIKYPIRNPFCSLFLTLKFSCGLFTAVALLACLEEPRLWGTAFTPAGGEFLDRSQIDLSLKSDLNVNARLWRREFVRLI